MIRPIGKRVLIKEEVVEEKRASGLIIPGMSDDRGIRYGVVEEIGRGIDEVNKGERIVFAKEAGRILEHNRQKYTLLEIDEILAVVGDEV